MDSTSTIQVAYQIIKDAKHPLTQPEIMESLKKAGRKAYGTIIYPLIKHGYVKKGEKDGRAAYYSTDLEPTFAVRKKRRKKREMAIRSVVDSPAIVISTPEQEEAAVQQSMGTSFNAIRGLQNTVATIKFATMLEENGPEQMLLMLSGLEHMRHRK